MEPDQLIWHYLHCIVCIASIGLYDYIELMLARTLWSGIAYSAQRFNCNQISLILNLTFFTFLGSQPASFRQLNTSLRMTGHTWAASMIPDWVMLPGFLLHASGNKFWVIIVVTWLWCYSLLQAGSSATWITRTRMNNEVSDPMLAFSGLFTLFTLSS